jgi:hypothetical protein
MCDRSESRAKRLDDLLEYEKLLQANIQKQLERQKEAKITELRGIA